MIAVITVCRGGNNFYPLLEQKGSLSFLPFSIETTLIGTLFSQVNSYFSRDKIFVVCRSEDLENVKKSCNGITEENIIIEPVFVNESVSLFFAINVLYKLYPEEIVFYIPSNFIFDPKTKMNDWILSASSVAEKNWIVLPTYLLDKKEVEKDYIDAGKTFGQVKNKEFFYVNSININKNARKKKIFGKDGKLLYILCSKIDCLFKEFSINDNNTFFGKMYNCFKNDTFDWDKIKNEYFINQSLLSNYNFYDTLTTVLTVFLERKPIIFEDFSDYDAYFKKLSDDNIIFGSCDPVKCKNNIVFNYTQHKLQIEGINDSVVVVRNNETSIVKKPSFEG